MTALITMNEVSNALVPVERGLGTLPTPEQIEATATFLAEEYQKATAEIARLMAAVKEQTERLHEAFKGQDDHPLSSYFDVQFYHDGRRWDADDATEGRMFKAMKRHAWEQIIDRLGIKNVMSVSQREKLEKQIQEDELPDITPEAIMGIVTGLAGQAQGFAQEAAREVYDLLRPQHTEYKTNDKFRVGRRVILSWYVERCWNGKQFRVSYYHEKHIRAIDAVFHLLDGKGVIREHRTPLIKAIEESDNGRGETTYFKFKCFKNRNLHLEFKNLELVKQLNLQAAGEYTLGVDAEE